MFGKCFKSWSISSHIMKLRAQRIAFNLPSTPTLVSLGLCIPCSCLWCPPLRDKYQLSLKIQLRHCLLQEIFANRMLPTLSTYQPALYWCEWTSFHCASSGSLCTLLPLHIPTILPYPFLASLVHRPYKVFQYKNNNFPLYPLHMDQLCCRAR